MSGIIGCASSSSSSPRSARGDGGARGEARHRKWFAEWIAEGQKKVVVKGGSLPELRALQAKARSMHLPTALVEDAGLTELPPGTVTCVGIGPGPNAIVDQVTGRLPLM